MHVCTYNVLGTEMAPIRWNGPNKVCSCASRKCISASVYNIWYAVCMYFDQCLYAIKRRYLDRMDFQWRDRIILGFFKNIFICVLKMNKSELMFKEHCHHLHILMLFQTCVYSFLCVAQKKNVGKQEVSVPIDFHCIFCPYSGSH